MDYNVTKIFNDNLKALKNNDIGLIINRGGLRSSKTVSILQLLTIYAIKHSNTEIIIVGKAEKKIRSTLLKDWKKFAIGDNYKKLGTFNKVDMLYSMINGSSIQFISGLNNEEDYRGIDCDILFIDEINTIQEGVYRELSSRCRLKTIVAFNPTNEFYITEEVVNRVDVLEIISTFKDNPFVSDVMKERWIARGKVDPNFQRVMVDGDYGNVEGQIFEENNEWFVIEELPRKTKDTVELWAIDWGFKPDPTAITQIYIMNDSIYVREWLYRTDLIPSQIAKEIKECNIHNEIMIADNARPEIIAEMQRTYGLNVHGVSPKPGILESIATMKEHKIFVTDDSTNIIQEFRNYLWDKKKKDKHGNTIPIDKWNHSIDGIRYVASSHFTVIKDSYTSIKW